MSNIAGATVALVILADLVTGDGPPILNAYRAQIVGQNPGYLGPPMSQVPGGPVPLGYMSRGDYEPGKAERDYAQAREEYEKSSGYGPSKEQDKLFRKELETLKLEDKLADKSFVDEKYLYGSSTPAPGMLSSLTNSMSGAWGSITGLGRKVRGADESEIKEETETEIKEAKEKKTEKKQVGRSFDNYEMIQNQNQGYIYFKVPRNLVCGQAL